MECPPRRWAGWATGRIDGKKDVPQRGCEERARCVRALARYPSYAHRVSSFYRARRWIRTVAGRGGDGDVMIRGRSYRTRMG